jgi:hypothetical protein
VLVNGGYLYWTERASDGSGRVRRVPVAGGTTAEVAQAQGAGALAFTGGQVYWSQESGESGVFRKSPTSGQPQRLLDNDGMALPSVSYAAPLDVVNNKLCYASTGISLADLDGKNHHYIEPGIPEGYAATCDTTHNYHTIQERIYRVPLTATPDPGDPWKSNAELFYTLTAAVGASMGPDVNYMIRPDGYLYYGTGYEPRIGRVSVTNATDSAERALGGEGFIRLLDKSGGTLYVILTTGAGTCTIGKLPANNLASGTLTVLDTATQCPTQTFGQATSDGEALYWSDGTAFFKIAK